MASSPPNPNPNPIDSRVAKTSPIFINSDTFPLILTHESLIRHFQTNLPTLSSTITTPVRQNYTVSPPSSLLLMPSWSSSSSLPYMGVKLVTHFPQNSSMNLPGIHASYTLFSSITGQTLASMDGTVLTLYRTSSISGLASKILARDDSQVLIMIGAGALAPHLIKSHLAAKPGLKRVIIWNRTPQKARDLAETLSGDDQHKEITFESSDSLDEIIPIGDIISCATNSTVPLIKGKNLKPGTHLDLVGSFSREMRECDDAAIRRGRVFVDNEAAMEEAGELVGAFERGVMKKEEVGGKLVEVMNGEKTGRKSSTDITVFKSVGSGTVDLLAAQLLYETYVSK
ncbi:PREDICTED: uncharacterized protein LOC104811948 [Tarenaya hassleriana]|uniref:uncharacterized protein LOC104811948 n=1 Tax=Tarenaya hassleriana TaxID=28532 RepID=UPI00053C0C4F|nr:PREDICTED: uncharacterized protein LOC104811948 [Tarenaya hassleriana]